LREISERSPSSIVSVFCSRAPQPSIQLPHTPSTTFGQHSAHLHLDATFPFTYAKKHEHASKPLLLLPPCAGLHRGVSRALVFLRRASLHDSESQLRKNRAPMKVLAGKPFAALVLLASATVVLASSRAIDGTWEGSATVRGQQVPIRLQISGSDSALKASL